MGQSDCESSRRSWLRAKNPFAGSSIQYHSISRGSLYASASIATSLHANLNSTQRPERTSAMITTRRTTMTNRNDPRRGRFKRLRGTFSIFGSRSSSKWINSKANERFGRPKETSGNKLDFCRLPVNQIRLKETKLSLFFHSLCSLLAKKRPRESRGDPKRAELRSTVAIYFATEKTTRSSGLVLASIRTRLPFDRFNRLGVPITLMERPSKARWGRPRDRLSRRLPCGSRSRWIGLAGFFASRWGRWSNWNKWSGRNEFLIPTRIQIWDRVRVRAQSSGSKKRHRSLAIGAISQKHLFI